MVATDQEPLDNDRFSDRALDTIGATSPEKSIFLNFEYEKKIGKIITANADYKLKGGVGKAVICEAEIDYLPSDEISTLYLVPGFQPITLTRSRGQTGHIIEDLRLLAFGLTAHPADKNLTPIEIVK